MTNLQIKHWGGSYPDVLEYKKDKVTDVKTYERLTGYDKNTGVDLRMPRYATFRFNNDSKITRMWVNDDQLLWKKAYDAYDTRKNGIIYKDHPFISNIRLMISGMQEMDIDKIRSYYDENARIYDVMNSGEFEFLTLDEEMANIDLNSFEKTMKLIDKQDNSHLVPSLKSNDIYPTISNYIPTISNDISRYRCEKLRQTKHKKPP